jgi:hypothetical protein
MLSVRDRDPPAGAGARAAHSNPRAAARLSHIIYTIYLLYSVLPLNKWRSIGGRLRHPQHSLSGGLHRSGLKQVYTVVNVNDVDNENESGPLTLLNSF